MEKFTNPTADNKSVDNIDPKSKTGIETGTDSTRKDILCVIAVYTIVAITIAIVIVTMCLMSRGMSRVLIMFFESIGETLVYFVID